MYVRLATHMVSFRAIAFLVPKVFRRNNKELAIDVAQ